MAENSSSSTLTTLPSSSSISTVLPISFPTIPIKLNRRNCLYWKGVMTPLLTIYGLLDYVEGRVVAPERTTTGTDGASQKKSGVTIRFAKTSHEAWTSLATAFLTQTAAQEDLLDQQWRDLKKGDQSMAKYIGSVKEQALKYAQIGKPKSPAAINRRIYTGLGPDWEPIVLTQSDRMLTMSTDELQSLLVGHEERGLYTAAQNSQIATPSLAPLLGILGSALVEIHYTSGREN
ncbi:uncharacterized protein LOC116193653 [Punica granatum]|uniref:Uncharacterized protein LOC116193653 n=1 Tax=Punica granatum TaxID=22663 RepID=A0A6P8C6Z7_PUNGR|nr:uncharacterized protein LOC116193653 [Punica granatum]